MNLRFGNYAGGAAMFLVARLVAAPAEEPAPQRGTPIILSESKPATVSSNLNQLESKASHFKDLESDLKKPFEIFDAGRTVGSFLPPVGLTEPPATSANNRRIKKLMDKRAERMFPGSDTDDPELEGDDLFKKSEDALDATRKKLKSPLDRYYDRLDRERSGLTNRVQKPDPAGNNKDPDGKDQFSRALPDKLFGGDLNGSMSSLGRLSTNAATGTGFFSDPPKPKSFDELLDTQPKDLAERSSGVKESRLDVFKQLLERPAYTPNPDYYSPGLPVAGAALRPVPASPWPSWSSSAMPGGPRDSFTSQAGLVGGLPQLQGLPGFAVTPPSLNLTPPPFMPPKQPAAAFNLPKRQF